MNVGSMKLFLGIETQALHSELKPGSKLQSEKFNPFGIPELSYSLCPRLGKEIPTHIFDHTPLVV